MLLRATRLAPLKTDSFFPAGPENRGGLSPVFRPRLRAAEKTGTVTVYSSPGARIPRVPPRRAKATGPSWAAHFHCLSECGGPHMRGYSENVPAAGVALTLKRPRSVCKVRLRGLPGSASLRRLCNRSAWLQPPRHNARSVVIFIPLQHVWSPHERLLKESGQIVAPPPDPSVRTVPSKPIAPPRHSPH